MTSELISIIKKLSAQFNLEAAALAAFIEVETGGRGFDSGTGKIMIQFEPVWFKRNAPYAPSGQWSVNKVFIHSKNNISNNTKSEKSSESFTDKLKDFSQNIVKENNVKERVAEMKKRTQEVNTKTGTFWSFGLITIFGVVTLIIMGIIIYLKKR